MAAAPDHLLHVRDVAKRVVRTFDKPPSLAAARKALEQALEAERDEVLDANARVIVAHAEAEVKRREAAAQKQREAEADGKRRRRDAAKAHRKLYGRRVAAQLAEFAPWDTWRVLSVGGEVYAFSERSKLEPVEEAARVAGLSVNSYGAPIRGESLGTLTPTLDRIDPTVADLHERLNLAADAARAADEKRREEQSRNAQRHRDLERYGVDLAGITEG